MTEVKKVEKVKGFGTKEWSDSSVNCFYGCSNNCSYCYAKRMAIRFNRETEESWKTMYPNKKAIEKTYRKRNGRIMFPTSHDITIESYIDCLIVLRKLLEAENEVLITTKPNLVVITHLTGELIKYKNQIQFRFTITSIDDKKLQEFEPNAPSFSERMLSLRLAYFDGYKTSVSIEPFLDKNPIKVIERVAPFCSETIWIGKLNYQTTEFNTFENIQKVIENLKLLPESIKSKIRIKDSIRNMYKKQGLEVNL